MPRIAFVKDRIGALELRSFLPASAGYTIPDYTTRARSVATEFHGTQFERKTQEAGWVSGLRAYTFG